MEPDALVAFLAAWLWRSMETLCPGSDDEGGWDEREIVEIVKAFDTAQREVVAIFLKSIVESPEPRMPRDWAEFGLKWWRA
jgi:hypothetical protein